MQINTRIIITLLNTNADLSKKIMSLKFPVDSEANKFPEIFFCFKYPANAFKQNPSSSSLTDG